MGSTVVSAGRDGTVKFWDLETAALLGTLPGLPDPFRAHITRTASSSRSPILRDTSSSAASRTARS